MSTLPEATDALADALASAHACAHARGEAAIASAPAAVVSREAYVTLVTTSSFVVGACTLAYSLRVVRAMRPLVCLVTPDLPSESRAQLAAAGCTLLVVPPIPNPNRDAHVASWIDVGFTKLRLWQLVQFDALVYIDADCLVRSNPDELFSRARDTAFAAAPDVFPPSNFNAGVLVVRPNLSLFAHMLHRLAYTSSYDGGDTGFLNALWPDWFDAAPPAARLHFRWNALRTMEWFTKKRPAYWNSLEPVGIVHHCSSPKPWETLVPTGRLEEEWFDTRAAMLDAERTDRTTLPALLALPTLDAHVEAALQSISWDRPDTVANASADVAPFTRSLRSASFDACMPNDALLRKHVWDARDVDWLASLRSTFESARRASATASPSAATSTPSRRIHQIWLGPKPLPSSFAAWSRTWQQHHPDWTYRLWTDADLAAFPYSQPPPAHHPLYADFCALARSALPRPANDAAAADDNDDAHQLWRRWLRYLLDFSSNVGYRSDIVRLDLLLAFGGLYVDTDFECVRAFDPLLFDVWRNARVVAGLSSTYTIEVNNGLIYAAAAREPLLYRYVLNVGRALVVQTMQGQVATDAGASESSGRVFSASDVLSVSGPGQFTRTLIEEWSLAGENVVVFPWTFFFPLPNLFRHAPARDRQAFAMPCNRCGGEGAAGEDEHARLWPLTRTLANAQLVVCAVHHWSASWVESTSKGATTTATTATTSVSAVTSNEPAKLPATTASASTPSRTAAPSRASAALASLPTDVALRLQSFLGVR